MKLKNIIFLTILALGTLPLLLLVSVNFQNHIQRHTLSLQEDIKKRSELNSRAFTQNLSSIHNDLNRLAGLHECQLLLDVWSGTLTADSAPIEDGVRRAVSKWYGVNSKIEKVILTSKDGKNSLVLAHRKQAAAFSISTAIMPEYMPSIISGSKHAGQFIYNQAQPKTPEDTKVVFHTKLSDSPTTMVIVVESQISSLIPDDETILWLTPSGELHNFHTKNDSGIFTTSIAPLDNAFSHDRLSRENFLTNMPFVWVSESDHTVSWIPIHPLNIDTPFLWAGIPIDKGNAKKWRRSLIKNITMVLLATMFVVFCIANFIALKIDHIKQNILRGLAKIFDNNQDVRFHWTGPKEITILADELNTLADRYFETKSASLLAEQQLRESEKKFRKLSSSAQDAIIMMDNNGDVAYWNKAAERMFGYPDHEAMGKPVHDLLSLTRPGDSLQNAFSEVPIKKRPSHAEIIELLAKTKNGSDLPIELSLSATEIQKQWHAIWIVRDISERKQSEKEAELRRHQLVQADKMRSLGLLVSGVAHEINNPNSIAMLNAPMLNKSWVDISPILESYYSENGDFTVAGLEYSEMRQQVPVLFAELMDSSKRIKNIVKDLKDYARKDKPSLAQDLDINTVIETAIRLTHNLVKKSTASFHTQLCTDCPAILGNGQRLEQVIINLIQNACEALTDKEQSITLSTTFEEDSSTILIKVCDEGVGMPEDTIAQATDPFFTTKRNAGGTGLGLSVSAGIIKEHGGSISFSSTPGEGTRTEVRLPVNNSKS